MLKSQFSIGILSALLVLPFQTVTTAQNSGRSDQLKIKSQRPNLELENRKIDSFNLPLSFESNLGQANPQYDYVARAKGYTVSLAPTEMVVVFNCMSQEDLLPNHKLALKFLGANKQSSVSAENHLPGKVNYLYSRDSSKQYTNISTHSRVRYTNIYPGIDIVYYGKQQQLEYDFIVGPGSSSDQIVFDVMGASSLHLENSDLVATVNNRSLRFEKPVIYQELKGRRVPISGGYVLKGKNRVGFGIGDYDHQRSLIIDPVLRYSSFLGGTGAEWGNNVKVDESGNVWLTGFTTSPEFPRTDGSMLKGGFDVFVSKFNSTGSTLLLSTIIGGTGSDTGLSLALDASGVYVSGITSSQDYPTTAGAFQTSANANQTGFVTKLNPSGSTILYSTYFGGTGGLGYGIRIALDSASDIYIAGSTNSAQLPTTPNAFQKMITPPGVPGAGDAFVAKLHPAGGGQSDLVYSSYLGGNLDDGIARIAVDDQGMVYLAGVTASTDFPTTLDALQPLPGSTDLAQRSLNTDAFLVKMDLRQSGAAGLLYSTYIGGTAEENIGGLALDNGRNVYLTGRSSSTNFTTTRNALQRQPGGKKDAYVLKINTSRVGLAGLIYSTYLGGSEDENSFGSGIAVDSVGNAYLTGDTRSTNLPITVGAFQPSIGGVSDVFSAPGGDAFIAKLNSAGTALVYFTYLGGADGDGAGTIAIDSNNNAYVSGYTFSQNFPLTPNARQTIQGGSFDSFLARVENPSSFEAPASPEFALPTVSAQTLPNPIDDAQKFVRQQYIDFLNREPDPDGLSFWTKEITNCGSDTNCADAKRVNVSAAFFLSIEFQQTGYLVERIYLTAFGRTPKLNEFSPDSREIGNGVVVNSPGWEQILEANKQAFMLSVVQRSDFKASFPNSMTADQFVDKLDLNAGNVLTAGEKVQLVSMLVATPTEATRASVLRAVAENPTLQQKEFNKAFVLMQYFGYLQRNPDDPPDNDLTGYNFWLTKLNLFRGNFINAEMVKAFISAGEYRKRFGQS
jgi:hypothetical protein